MYHTKFTHLLLLSIICCLISHLSLNAQCPAAEVPTNTSPYCQSFENMATGTAFCSLTTDNLSECWTNDTGNPTPWMSVATSFSQPGNLGAASGNNFVVLAGSGCTNPEISILNSPIFDLTGLTGIAQLEFYYGYNFGSNSLVLEVSTDGIVWTPINTYDNSNTQASEWTFISVNLSAYLTSTTFQFRFIGNKVAGADLVLDEVCITACPTPSNVVVNNVTNNSAEISWIEIGTATGWEIEIVPTGTPPSGSGTATSTNPHSATGLIPDTVYDVYVYSVCGPGSVSNNSLVTTFQTPCLATSALFYCQDFETMGTPSGTASCISNFPTNLSECWYTDYQNSSNQWLVTSGASTISGTGPSGAYTGGNYLATTNGCGAPATVFTAPLDFTTTTTPFLEFYYHMFGSSIGSINVEISTDGGATWAGIWGMSGNQGNQWNLASVDLAAYSAFNDVQMRIVYINIGSGSKGVVGIDDFCITDIASCTAVSDLSISNIDINTADLSWVATNNLASSYTINLTVSGNPDASQTFSATTSPFTLTGLLEGTEYDVSVISDCGANGVSQATITTFYTDCDIPPFPFCEGFEGLNPSSGICGTDSPFYLNNCVSNDLSNANNWQVNSGLTTSISGTSASIPTANSGDNYIYLESGGGCHNTTSILNFATFDLSGLTGSLFLDFYYSNNGGAAGSIDVEVSTDGGSTWANVFNTSGTQPPGWINANVDLSAYLGSTQFTVRFIGITGDNFLSDMALDDICFTQCLQPTDLIFSNITTTGFDVGWTANNGETDWNIEIVEVGTAPTGAGVATTTNPHSATGLTSGTNYEVYVQADCGGSVSPFSVVGYVKTTPECGDIVQDYGNDENYPNGYVDFFTVCPDVAGDVVFFTFTEAITESADAINVYDGIGTGTLNTGNISGETVVISNSVDGCLTFQFNNNAATEIDGVHNDAGYTMEVSCASCIPVSDVTVANTTETTADISWTANGAETAWQVEIVPHGTTPTGTGISTTSNPYNATGLNSGTFYDVYVYADCGGGNLSDVPFETIFNTQFACGDIIYDAGGPNGNYPDATPFEITNFTLCPTSPGEFVTFSITELNTGGDFFQVYNGNSTGAPVMGTAPYTAPITFTSTDASGCLTYQLINVTNGSFSGFEIFTSCSACLPPTNVVLSNVMGTSFDVTWTANGNEVSWDIEILPIGQLPTGTGVNVTTNSYSASGLTDGETYNVFIAPNCGGDGSGSPIVATSVTLPCPNPTLADNCQGFENMPLGNGDCGDVGVLTNCWENYEANDENWQVTNGTNINNQSGTQNYLSDGAAVGDNFIFLGALNDNTVGCDASTGAFYSPIYDISAYTSYPLLEFYFRIQGASAGGLSISASVDGGAYANIFSVSGDQGSNWLFNSIDLSAYAGASTIQFQFYGSTNFVADNGATYIGVVAMDEICVRQACVTPTAICQDITIYLDETGNATITPADIDNGSDFNCGLMSMSLDITDFDCNNLAAPVEVTLTVTNLDGQSDNCTAAVTVLDNVTPSPGGILSVNPFNAELNIFSISDYVTLDTTIALTETAGGNVTGANGVSQHPITGDYYIIYKLQGVSGRMLGTLDPSTGVITPIGNTGNNFAGITFDNTGILYGVTGDGASPPETLYTIDTSTAATTFVVTLGAGSDGESIVFNPDDGLIYHASGRDTNFAFEAIDPSGPTVTNIPITGFQTDEVFGMVYLGGGDILVSNLDQEMVIINSSGASTLVGAHTNTSQLGSSLYARGMALYGNSVVISACCDLAIDTPPMNDTICVGEMATFSVAASTSQTGLSYQWQSVSGGVGTDIGGETNAIYTFTPTLSDNGNMYRVLLSDDFGCVDTSEVVSLTVYNTPDIATISPQTNNCPNETAFDLTTLTVTDNNSVAGTTTSFHTAAPTTATDMSNQITGANLMVMTNQTVFVMVANTTTGCFDVESFMVTIDDCCNASSGTWN